VIGYLMQRSISEWETYIGEQIKTLRLRLNISQSELAGRAGISTVTVSRLESGKSSSLASFIKVLQVLRQEDWLEQLAPTASISPIQIHTLGKPRQRARKRSTIKPTGPTVSRMNCEADGDTGFLSGTGK
jgi:transcriptional regulator with XRE-family HTH domain